jgi:hypothetical protein
MTSLILLYNNNISNNNTFNVYLTTVELIDSYKLCVVVSVSGGKSIKFFILE